METAGSVSEPPAEQQPTALCYGPRPVIRSALTSEYDYVALTTKDVVRGGLHSHASHLLGTVIVARNNRRLPQSVRANPAP